MFMFVFLNSQTLAFLFASGGSRFPSSNKSGPATDWQPALPQIQLDKPSVACRHLIREAGAVSSEWEKVMGDRTAKFGTLKLNQPLVIVI